MKYIAIFLLTGCSLLPARSFDSVLYGQYAWVAVTLTDTMRHCDDAKTVEVNVHGTMLILDQVLLYEKYRSDPLVMEATELVKKDVGQLLDAYSLEPAPSTKYCQLKLKQTEESLERIMQAMAGKQ